MTRRGGGSTQRQALPSSHVPNGNSNGLPPPSTIPAQIVHSAAHVRAQQSNADKQPFIELVKEFLSNPVLEDPDPVCIAFILAITEGGIDPLFEGDPFAMNHLIAQGTQCIAALNVIFQQKPYLLLAPTHAEDAAETSRSPVILWLFPKVLGLLAQESLVATHASVIGLLGTCLDSSARSGTRVYPAQSIFRLYRSCIGSGSHNLYPCELETY